MRKKNFTAKPESIKFINKLVDRVLAVVSVTIFVVLVFFMAKNFIETGHFDRPKTQ